MSIAALTQNLLLGGANTFLLNFLRGLGSRPEKLTVLSFTEGNELAADFDALGAEVRLGLCQGMIYEDRLRRTYGQLASLQPRAVLACLGSEGFEMLRLAPAGVARIGIVQSDDPLVYAMAARYGASLDAMVGVSTAIAERLRTRPEFRGVRVAEIPYGIGFAPPIPRPLRSREKPLRVLYLGRIIKEQKRIDRIVQLAGLLHLQAPHVQVTIAGSGPDEEWVRGAVSHWPNVTLAGAVPNHEVTALLRRHDLFVLLSDYEGLPLSLLEAMGEGVVPIVSDLASGMAQAVTAETGIRLRVCEETMAAEACSAILALDRDRERLAALSAAATAHARGGFSAERMVADYLQLIDELAAPVAPAWPERVSIPAPYGVPAWLFSGAPRWARRWLKRLQRP